MSKKQVVTESFGASVIDVSAMNAELKGPRVHGKGKGLANHENYFPPAGSMSRSELERIAESPLGSALSEFKLTEIFLGKMVSAGLLNVKDGMLFASDRCRKIMSGEIVLASNRAAGTGFYSLFRQLRECKTEDQIAAIVEQLGAAKLKLLARKE